MISKIIKLTSLLVCIIFFNACCRNCDVCVECNDKLEQADQELVNDYIDNIEIKNGVVVEGSPAPPIGNLSFTIVADRPFALFDEGFDFTLNATSEVEGIYLRVKRGDAISDDYLNIAAGTPSTEIYFDTDLKSNLGDGVNTIIGAICYEIIAYDTQGNISHPTEICFDLHGWGNDLSIAGAWELEYYEEFHNETLISRNVGERYCDNGQENPCYSRDWKFLLLEDDGSFWVQTLMYEYDNGGADSDYDRYEENVRGKWIYINNQLFLIKYKTEHFKNNEAPSVIELGPGDGKIINIPELIADDEFQPLHLTLVIQRYDNDGDGNIDASITEYYGKPLME